MKSCVVGGAGFVGSHLTDYLIEKGHKVVVFDDLSSGKKENINPKAKFIKGDITEYAHLEDSMESCDIVFHLAAIPRVLYSVKYPKKTHDTNVTGALNVILASRANNIKKIVFASSSAVVGNPASFPTKESARINPLSPYAAHKAIGEMYMKMFSNLYKMDITVIRFFNCFGTRCDPTSEYSLVIPKFIHKIKTGKIVEIYGDGEQSRDMIYVTDAVDAMYKAKDLSGFNILNIGTGLPTTINKIVEILKQELGDFKVVYTPARTGETRKTHADITKATNILNWTPKVTINEGIKDILKNTKV